MAEHSVKGKSIKAMQEWLKGGRESLIVHSCFTIPRRGLAWRAVRDTSSTSEVLKD